MNHCHTQKSCCHESKNNLVLKYKKLSPNATPPRRAKVGDAGYDLYSAVDIVVPPVYNTSEAVKVHTDIAIELPPGKVGLVWDRSGLGSKLIKVFGGVIDSSYRGNLIVCLANFGNKDLHIKVGDRIAQLLVQSVDDCVINEGELSETDRQNSGFGSTGR